MCWSYVICSINYTKITRNCPETIVKLHTSIIFCVFRRKSPSISCLNLSVVIIRSQKTENVAHYCERQLISSSDQHFRYLGGGRGHRHWCQMLLQNWREVSMCCYAGTRKWTLYNEILLARDVHLSNILSGHLCPTTSHFFASFFISRDHSLNYGEYTGTVANATSGCWIYWAKLFS